MAKVLRGLCTSLLLFSTASTTIYYGMSYTAHLRLLMLNTLQSRFAIVGLTYQYTTSHISREDYDKYQQIYFDEVARLNPSPPSALGDKVTIQNPDDNAVYATEEFRFMMFRHWTLYDAMYHSSYVASKLGIWKERGRKKLTGLLAKMGSVVLFRPALVRCTDTFWAKDFLYHRHNSRTPTWRRISKSL